MMMEHINIFQCKTITFEVGGEFEYKQLLAEDELEMDTSFCYTLIDGVQSFDVRRFNILRLAHNLKKAYFSKEMINQAINVEKVWSELEIKDKIKLLLKIPSSVFEQILKKADEVDYPNLDLKKKLEN